MNDEFLTKIHKVPRPEFGDALYERISQQSQPHFAQSLARWLTFRHALVAFVLLFFTAAFIYVVVERGWHKVGGIWINVQPTYTLELVRVPDISAESLMQPQEEVACLTVEEAKETLRFKLKVPTWAPEGFVFDDRICGINQISDFASLYWKGPDEDAGIQLELSNLRWYDVGAQKYRIGEPAIWSPVGFDSYQEVQVHGQPAILIRGDWDSRWMTEREIEGKRKLLWVKGQALQLYWVDGEAMYHLYTQADIPAEDLIQMAESAQ